MANDEIAQQLEEVKSLHTEGLSYAEIKQQLLANGVKPGRAQYLINRAGKENLKQRNKSYSMGHTILKKVLVVFFLVILVAMPLYFMEIIPRKYVVYGIMGTLILLLGVTARIFAQKSQEFVEKMKDDVGMNDRS
jgi:hypothetical protein